MATSFKAKRRDFTKSRTPSMHHFAWSIVCLLLLGFVAGVWTHAQSLDRKVDALEQQLSQSKRPAPSTCRTNGDWKAGATSVHDVKGRKYLVHLPSTFTQHDYYPLVMFYPGKGASAEGGQAAYGLDSLPAVVVYPSPTMGTDGYNAWQGAPYSSKSDDVAFTASILDQVQSDLCIDRTRVYAVGLSNGGGFTSLLSCKLPDRFAAYAIIAGAMYAPNGQCKPGQPVPLISVHGDQDGAVPYDGSPLRQLPPIETWTTERAKLNGCTSSSVDKSAIQTVVTTWNGCRDNATVRNIRIVGGEHGWGGFTTESLWQFLSRFSL